MAKRSVETAWNLLVEVRAGDQIGFRSSAQPDTHRQQLGGNVTSLDFEIDREGTFTRVRDRA